MRADSGFYTHALVAVCREMDVCFSITDRDGETLVLEADHRHHAEVENAIRDLKYGVGLNHLPSGRFAANGARLAVQVMAHNLARWTTRIGLLERTVITKALRRRGFAQVGRRLPAYRAASPCVYRRVGHVGTIYVAPWYGCGPYHSRPDGQPATEPTSPQTRASPVPGVSCCEFSRHPAHRSSRRRPQGPCKATEDRPPTPIYPNGAQAISPVAPSPPPLSPRGPSGSIGVHRWIRAYHAWGSRSRSPPVPPQGAPAWNPDTPAAAL